MNDKENTLEQIVVRIQNGEEELLTELWSRVIKFVNARAKKYLMNYPEECAQYHEDMVCEAYFGLLKAVKTYNDELGYRFTTHLSYHLRNSFKTALLGGVTKRYEKEPINNYLSMDAPVPGEDDLTIADTLEDETAEKVFRSIEDEDYQRSLRRFILDCIEREPSPFCKDVLKYMLRNGCTWGVACKNIYGSLPDGRQKVLYDNARKRIKKYIETTAGKVERDQIGLDGCITTRGGGFSQFRNSKNYSSCVETSVIARERRRNGLKQKYRMQYKNQYEELEDIEDQLRALARIFGVDFQICPDEGTFSINCVVRNGENYDIIPITTD